MVCYQEGHDKVEACHCMQEGVGCILAVIVPTAVAVVIAEVVLMKREGNDLQCSRDECKALVKVLVGDLALCPSGFTQINQGFPSVHLKDKGVSAHNFFQEAVPLRAVQEEGAHGLHLIQGVFDFAGMYNDQAEAMSCTMRVAGQWCMSSDAALHSCTLSCHVSSTVIPLAQEVFDVQSQGLE